MRNNILNNTHKSSNRVHDKRYFILLLILFSFTIVPATHAQVKRVKQEEVKTVPAKSRWSFRTNALDWLLTVPNIGVEYDLSNSVYNKFTLNLEGKWNWHTSHNYAPGVVFDLWDIRPEVRKYWRTEHRPNTGNKPGLKDKLFSKGRSNPKYWRAYYLGAYTSMNGYSFKFGKRGFQGNSYGFGISGGYSIPLYSYKNHFIDVEFGGSLGLSYAKYDVYELDRDNNCYIPVPEKSKSYHFVPFPVVSDIRVSFVYRFTSVKDKYKMINHEKIQARERLKIEKRQRKDSIRSAKHLADSLEDMRSKFVKDSIKQAKQIADSIAKIPVKDSLKINKNIAPANENSAITPKKKTAKKKDKKKKSSENTEEKQQAVVKRNDEKES